MQRSHIRRRVPVPHITTSKATTKDFQFVGGIDSNSANDEVGANKWVYASDAREIQIGKWQTRHGANLLSMPIGFQYAAQITSTTGQSDFNFNSTTWVAQKVQSLATDRAVGFELPIRNLGAATGTVVVALYTDNSGTPGTEIARTTIASSRITSSYSYIQAFNVTCPDITIGVNYWIVAYVQAGGTGNYQIMTTTVATTGQVSINSGISYTAQTFAFDCKLISATAGGTKGCYSLIRPNGTKYTFVAHGTTLYSVNLTTGAVTAVDTGLNSATTTVRFDYVADTLRYVQVGSSAKPRKYDFTTASSVTTSPDNASAIISHAGLEFFASADDTSKLFFTNFGIYDTFTSTDFIYVPAPKTSDPIVGFSKLVGSLYIHTRNNKYQLSGKENATFQLDNAVGQKGTFTQESLCYDEDYIYLASDDGIYRFNGAEEKNICVNDKGGAGVQDWWNGLLNKRNTVLELYNNRLYIFYTPNGESQNTRCKVYNILYDVWESDDTKCYIGQTYASADQANYFIQASNRIGMLMLGEVATNEHNMLGEQLDFQLWTAYNHHGTPAQLKRASEYRPHFDTVTGNYNVSVGYATDYNASPTLNDVALAGSGPRFDSGVTFNSGAKFGSTAQVNPMDSAPIIPGEWRRLQLRYGHTAAREPVSFDGHVLNISTQRMN